MSHLWCCPLIYYSALSLGLSCNLLLLSDSCLRWRQSVESCSAASVANAVTHPLPSQVNCTWTFCSRVSCTHVAKYPKLLKRILTKWSNIFKLSKLDILTDFRLSKLDILTQLTSNKLASLTNLQIIIFVILTWTKKKI